MVGPLERFGGGVVVGDEGHHGRDEVVAGVELAYDGVPTSLTAADSWGSAGLLVRVDFVDRVVEVWKRIVMSIQSPARSFHSILQERGWLPAKGAPSTAHSVQWERALLSLFALVLTSCIVTTDDKITIRNGVYEDLTITLLDSEHGNRDSQAPANNSTGFGSGGSGRCLGEGLVAVNAGGEEIARFDGEVCGGDEWIIDRDGSAHMDRD